MTFSSQFYFKWMKASLVAYDLEELHKNSELKTMKINYFKGYPKCLAIQI
jgi:hypothetical protein